MIVVCPLSKIGETAERFQVDRMISLVSAGTQVVRPARICPQDHLLLTANDIADAQEGLTLPGEEHVRQVLDFAASWGRSKPMLVHCFAGVSRSTATAYFLTAALSPQRDEFELAQTLRRLSPTATPNPRIIAVADQMLGRDGRMVRAIAGIGRGEDCFEGVPFELKVGLDV